MLKLSRHPMMVGHLTLFIFSSMIFFFKYFVFWPLLFGIFFLSVLIWQWTLNVKFEGMCGYHTSSVKFGLKLGFIIFVFTEIMLFVSIFWAFFDSSISIMVDGGMVWPPFYIKPFNPFSLPLMNTMLLLFSSISLTWSHMEFFNGEHIHLKIGMTLFLGFLFVFLQYLEYTSSTFTYSSGIYGCVFFTLTGLHGMHVIVGGVFLLFFLIFYLLSTYSTLHSLWLDLASFYWHFVDVVWFFVWGFVYIWGF